MGYKVESPSIIRIVSSIDDITFDNIEERVTGYGIVDTDGTIINLPSGYTPAECLDYSSYDRDKDEGQEQYDNDYFGGFMNGVIKMVDSSNHYYLWSHDKRDFITPDNYDNATYYEEGVIGVEKNGKWAFMDMDGKMLTDYLFDKVSALYDGKAYVKYNGQVGIIDLKTTCMNAGIEHNFTNES